MTRVSVVIPAHNAVDTIGRAIRSVAYQTVRPAEILVVDDHSVDGTPEVVQDLSPEVPVTLLHSGGRGAAAARNTGVDAATGDLVAFLDADDVWYPSKLEEQLPLLAEDIAFVGGLLHYVSSEGRLLGTNARYTDWDAATEDLRAARAMPVPLSTMLVRRADLERLGGFDETFVRAQDLELASRLVAGGRRVVWPERRVLGAYVIHGRSMTAQSYREQFLAAELIRARVRGETEATYQEWQADPQVSRATRRAAASGEHYRAAAVAVGEGRRGAYLGHAMRSVALDPLGAARKVKARKANQGELTPSTVPAQARMLFGAGTQSPEETDIVRHEVAGLWLAEQPEDILSWLPPSYAQHRRLIPVFAAHISSLNSLDDPAFRAEFNQATVAHADGISLSILAWARGVRADKMATTDLAPKIFDALARELGRPLRLAVLGGEPGIAESSAHVVAADNPVEVVLTEHGYHDDWSTVLERVRDSDPDVLLVGLGMPKEAHWVAEHRDELPPAVLISCGGWLRILAGEEQRAPGVMQRLEMEWLWRILTDPGRTWRRYVTGLPRLASHVALELRSRGS